MFINLSCCCPILLLLSVRAGITNASQRRRALDGARSNHLLLQVLLVRADAAVPAGDGLVLAHHDVLGDLVEESVKEVLVNGLYACKKDKESKRT